MRILRPGADLRRFFELVSLAQARALLLDYDGTLAPFVVKRDRARPFPEVWAQIARIAREGRTRVALVSGRPVRNLEGLVGRGQNIDLWGSHGAERITADGRCWAASLSADAERFLRDAEAWATKHGWGALVERKPFGLALHGRGQDPVLFALVRASAEASLGFSARQAGCEIAPFDQGIELRVQAHQKGAVVDTLAREAGEGAVMAYLGDDFPDEEAFQALSGRGLAVLVRDSVRPTNADIWICPPAELLWFLDEWEKAEGFFDRSKAAT